MGGVADKVKVCSRHETIGCASMRVLAVSNDLGAGDRVGWGGCGVVAACVAIKAESSGGQETIGCGTMGGRCAPSETQRQP